MNSTELPLAATGGPRLAYLVSQYPAISHTFILREVRGLRELGFTVHPFSINAPDRPEAALTQAEKEEAAATFYVKRQGPFRALAAHLRAAVGHPLAYLRGLVYSLRLSGSDIGQLPMSLFYFTEALLIGHRLRRLQIDHLHVHFATAASTVALILLRVVPVRMSLTVHGPDEFYDVSRYHLPAKIEAAAFICCISAYARSQVMKLSAADQWSKFEVAPLGIDPDAFTPRPFRPAPAPFEIVCVGRLVPAKGQHILLQACAQLIAGGRDLHLTLVGDGPDRGSLEAEVRRLDLASQVHFTGAVDQDRIRGLYEGADAFALASFAEGVPVVLMEAMAMEIPCVTTRITGIPELIRDGEDGLLVPASDIEALAAALARLMDDPQERQRLGVNGRLRVLEKYHLPRNVERLADVFRRRLEGG